MSNRYKVIIAIGITLLMATIFIANVLANETWLSSERVAVHVVMDNRINKQIGPLFISGNQDSEPLRINQIEPFSVIDVYYIKQESWGENEVTMTDSNGEIYPVIPYFETQQKGRVDIRIECITPGGLLSGKIRMLLSWYFSFEWRSWGALACEYTYN